MTMLFSFLKGGSPGIDYSTLKGYAAKEAAELATKGIVSWEKQLVECMIGKGMLTR